MFLPISLVLARLQTFGFRRCVTQWKANQCPRPEWHRTRSSPHVQSGMEHETAHTSKVQWNTKQRTSVGECHDSNGTRNCAHVPSRMEHETAHPSKVEWNMRPLTCPESDGTRNSPQVSSRLEHETAHTPQVEWNTKHPTCLNSNGKRNSL